MINSKKMKQTAESNAKSHGYYLNPDSQFLNDLIEGLIKNENKYGYPSCPCRLSTGNFDIDRDIICPCDYLDLDVAEYGNCYCALYVNKEVFEGTTSMKPIPERRPMEKQQRAYQDTADTPSTNKLKIEMKMWYCKQCGYVCFREEPPSICPICKAGKIMFNKITLNSSFSIEKVDL